MLNIDLAGKIISHIADSGNEYWVSKITNHDAQIHLAIMIEPYFARIMSGSKTIESRFAQKRIAPYDRVNSGDIIVLKKSGGAVTGVFEAGYVINRNISNQSDIADIRGKYGLHLSVEENFWQAKKDSRFVTIIEIRNLLALTPMVITEKNRLSWLVLGSISSISGK